MFLSTVAKYINLSFEIIKTNILTAMEYRTSFLIQVLGMIVNDTALIFVWVIFFKQFNQINGWTFADTAMLYAITTINFGLVMAFFRGSFELARTIARGELDYFLALPKNVLWHVSISRSEISALGDTIFGIIIFFFAGDVTVEKAGLFVFYVLISTIILFSFTVITQSMAFWFGNFEEAAEQIFHSLIGFTLYPQTVFHGLLKIVMLTLIPAFFIATLPVQLIRNFDPVLTVVMLVYAASIFCIAAIIFTAGLRSYESGNLINVRI